MRLVRSNNTSSRAARARRSLSARLCGAALAAGLALLSPGLAAQADTDAETAVATEVVEVARDAEGQTPETGSDAVAADAASDAATDEATPDAGGQVPAAAEQVPVAEIEAPASDEPVEESSGGDPTTDAPGDENASTPAEQPSDTPADATEPHAAQLLPDMFVVAVTLLDAAGEPVYPVPEGFDWTVSATGPVTYTPEEFMREIVVEEPVAGTYRLDVTLNSAAAAQMKFQDLICSYMIDFDDMSTFEPDIEYQVGGAWHVDVRAAHTTSCMYVYEVTGPLPDPSFELTGLMMLPGETPDGDRAHVGDESDFAVALVADDGSTAATLVAGQKVQVPPGEYTPRVVASASAQAGFDVTAWQSDGWNCLGSEHTPYGGTITLEPGGVVACNTLVSDASVDLTANVDRVGPVDIDWNGVTGAVGTEFDIVVDVEDLMLPRFSVGSIDDLRLTLRMGDNVALVDPAQAPAGWGLLSADGDTYTYAPEAAFAAGGEAQLTFRAVLTAERASSAVEACVASSRIDLNLQNNCWSLHAVADGEDNEEPPTEPEDPEDPVDPEEPEEPEQPEEPGNEEPEDEEPEVEDPVVEEPEVEVREDDAQSDDTADLARTGSEAVNLLPLGAGAAGVMILGSLLMMAGRLRRS